MDFDLHETVLYSTYIGLSLYIIFVASPIGVTHPALLLHVVTEPLYTFVFCIGLVIIATYVDIGIALFLAIILALTQFDVIKANIF